ncbi:acid phosphatase [Aureobasidium sp. EXF-3400]|nr:acid phosphatase [Aureobasidium sp. EXF-12344]KAI4776770.1 acid phosphatase [Aureobasidium sp. EXF-3400]
MANESAHVLPTWVARKGYKELDGLENEVRRRCISRFVLCTMALTAAGLLALGVISSSSGHIIPVPSPQTCDSVQNGYQCQPQISHYWGQYSPYFSVPSEIPANVPLTCSVTFAQILSRHGARDPTAAKTAKYNATIAKIHKNVANFTGKYAFLDTYEYTLGADQLTDFGRQQMENSGTKYYERYADLARKAVPFVRSSGEARVVESAEKWVDGFTQAKTGDRWANNQYPSVDVVISEAAGSNNTLNHDLCTVFEDGPDSNIANAAQNTWVTVFVPAIQKRINADLPGANLTSTEIIYLMDLCPFNTVASPTGAISPFCSLFTETEWQDYGYYESLNKFYGYGSGNPLGPTQGVGFTNELIARLTKKPVVDHTSTNHTLDNSAATFPLDRALYADFSHDNDMTGIFFAMGLYNSTSALSNTTLETAQQTNGYSASYTVPFGARAYIEKLQCLGHSQELVRVIVNDRAIPLHTCGADLLGRCTLSDFVDSLSFARSGGDWASCFA